jgi:hypothetical protein
MVLSVRSSLHLFLSPNGFCNRPIGNKTCSITLLRLLTNPTGRLVAEILPCLSFSLPALSQHIPPSCTGPGIDACSDATAPTCHAMASSSSSSSTTMSSSSSAVAGVSPDQYTLLFTPRCCWALVHLQNLVSC